MKIRYATKDDAELLAELGAKTFNDTFAKDNKPEDMAIYLAKSFSPAIQLDELNDVNTIYLIIEHDNNAIGYAKLKYGSRCESITVTNTIEIERIYSLKEYIGKGIGAALMQAAIKEAKDRGCDSIWLGVWEHNQVAINFYQKWGFKIVGSHAFMLGNDLQTDHIMELVL